jgi:hypothetical protein
MNPSFTYQEFIMSLSRLALSALFCSTFALPVLAQDKDADHKAHHPSASASASVMAKTAPAGDKAGMAKMDDKMKMMQEMHQKMMAAKTTEEKQAMMAEHMKAMKEGMGMMADMKKQPMSAADKQKAMEKRMEMMETMMHMMMDRMTANDK